MEKSRSIILQRRRIIQNTRRFRVRDGEQTSFALRICYRLFQDHLKRLYDVFPRPGRKNSNFSAIFYPTLTIENSSQLSIVKFIDLKIYLEKISFVFIFGMLKI